MNIESLIAILETAPTACRRLDALITGYALAPEGWSLDPIEDLDGWAVNRPSSEGVVLWMYSDDVPYITRQMDAAAELVMQARPEDAAAICARGLARHLAHPVSNRPFTQAIACRMAAELLKTLQDERQQHSPAVQRAA